MTQQLQSTVGLEFLQGDTYEFLERENMWEALFLLCLILCLWVWGKAKSQGQQPWRRLSPLAEFGAKLKISQLGKSVQYAESIGFPS